MTDLTTLEIDSNTANEIAKKINPLSNRVVLVPLQNANTTAGGIVIPDSATKDGSGMGQVIAVGPGKKDDSGTTMPVTVKSGQIVYYSKYSGTEIKINGVKALIITEDDILAIQTN